MTLVLKVSCRACNRECGDYKHLMDETVVDNEKTTLAAILNYCTNLDIKANNDCDDELPEHICNSCVEHLIQAFLFKEMVLETDRYLRSANVQEQILNSKADNITEILESNLLKTGAEISSEVITEVVMEVPGESISTSSIQGDESVETLVVEQADLPLDNNLTNLENISQFTQPGVDLQEEVVEDTTNGNVIQDGLIVMHDAVVVDETMVDDENDEIIYEMEEWLEMEDNADLVNGQQLIETIDGQEVELENSSYIAQNRSEGNCETNDYDSDDTLLVEEETDDLVVKENEDKCLIELHGSNYVHSDKENSSIEHSLAAIIEEEENTGEDTEDGLLNSEIATEKTSFSSEDPKTNKPPPTKRRSVKVV